MKEIKGVKIEIEEIKEDVTKVIPAWMDETDGRCSYFNKIWTDYKTANGIRQFKSIAGLKRSVYAMVREDYAGIPSNKISIRYTDQWDKDGDIQAFINYN